MGTGCGVTMGDLWAVGHGSWMGAIVSVGEWHAEGGTYGGQCHGLSLSPPCPSEAKPLPLMARLISDTLRLTSNPTGSSVYFSFSLTDSRMFLLSFFT